MSIFVVTWVCVYVCVSVCVCVCGVCGVCGVCVGVSDVCICCQNIQQRRNLKEINNYFILRAIDGDIHREKDKDLLHLPCFVYWYRK